ncbi:LytR C-terminal domain-containing protein [Arcanobacterium ihumii]|uniref:LytR C-terminal domain-containing protein n=1 Tax=Arcanobacterium ihumii TaxID=2138162 RepID=UPI000F527F6F|nr:LytR C-terminal domain-containing protein [Arcanobacterium ihumii]
MADNYPEDEFDLLAQERESHGAHRVPRNNHGWWIALIAILVFAPLIGIGAGQLYASTRTSSSETASSSTTESSTKETDKDSKSEDATKDSKDSSSSSTADANAQQQPAPAAPATPPAPTPSMDAKVQVLNGKGTRGYAAQKTKVLTDGGYTSVVADNYTKSAPKAATVYFADDTMEVTARDIAAKLGISQVLKAPDVVKTPNQIVVILR